MTESELLIALRDRATDYEAACRDWRDDVPGSSDNLDAAIDDLAQAALRYAKAFYARRYAHGGEGIFPPRVG